MAAASTTLPVWRTFCVLVPLLVHAAPTVAEGNGSLPCVDGTYEHGGRICCLCGAGQHVKEHCTTSQPYGVCEHCAANTYSSLPNSLDSCEPCTSCSQPNANLEVKRPCSSASDATCRCKKDHYCSSGTETCRICNPCKECPDGIKVACTSNNNTVCNEKVEGVHNIGVILGIVAISVIGLGLLAFYFIRKCWKKRNRDPAQPSSADPEMQPLAAPVVDLQPHLSDIAETIGWRDMHVVALKSRIESAIIESCRLDHPNDSQEQTLRLLQIWVESQGNEASRILIESLQNSNRRAKAEKVIAILSRS
ncbi:tumor necrosis factor receptor superfamily member 23 [Pseudoliparis swirei]|uniref:tumor necrosis factor receptor superfamily member 23 n=1 Tax=Pseudoliparis swirei TaxID=2059687 RepID=UPI0024BDA760|nr:tumor necrosis factor receptor superfamily member 23 [Pseudoliparis swirei]